MSEIAEKTAELAMKPVFDALNLRDISAWDLMIVRLLGLGTGVLPNLFFNQRYFLCCKIRNRGSLVINGCSRKRL